MLRRVRTTLLPPGITRIEATVRILALAGLLVLAVRSWISAERGSFDFDGFHGAGTVLLEHGRLSQAHAVARYLPHFQVLHVPLALLPVGLAALLWYLLSVAALVALPREIERLSGVAPRQQVPAWFVALPFVIDNLHLGQSGPVLLWASLWAVNRVRAGAAARGGALLGLVASFKIPALALTAPAVLLGSARRVLFGWAACVALLTWAMVAMVGVDEAARGVADWVVYVGNGQSPAAMIENDSGLRHNNQSLAITLARTIGDMPDALRDDAVVLARLPLDVVWTATTILSCLLAALGLLCVVRARRRGADRESWLVVTSLCALGQLLVSPLVWTHYFVWALPALVALRARPRALWVAGCVSLACLASDAVRALGAHLWLSVALFVLVAVRFLLARRPDSLAVDARGR